MCIYFFIYRLIDTVKIIQEYYHYFATICEHGDIVATIFDYLEHFSVQIIHEKKGTYNNILVNAIVKIY